ncbi:hypothetical protein OHN37_00620 [Streptomyces sp. NBC_00485]|nr:hypothetical protein [Streptomyces sp. NBC_00474]
MPMTQPPAVILGQGCCRVDPLGDPYERVEPVEREVRHGQRVEHLRQCDDIPNCADPVRRELDPERHRAARSLDRLLDRQRADGRHFVLGEPTGHADLTHSRLSLAAARDADDHLAGKTPYLVLGDPNGLSACWVEACEGAGLIQCSAVGDGRDRHACKVAVIR